MPPHGGTGGGHFGGHSGGGNFGGHSHGGGHHHYGGGYSNTTIITGGGWGYGNRGYGYGTGYGGGVCCAAQCCRFMCIFLLVILIIIPCAIFGSIFITNRDNVVTYLWKGESVLFTPSSNFFKPTTSILSYADVDTPFPFAPVKIYTFPATAVPMLSGPPQYNSESLQVAYDDDNYWFATFFLNTGSRGQVTWNFAGYPFNRVAVYPSNQWGYFTDYQYGNPIATGIGPSGSLSFSASRSDRYYLAFYGSGWMWAGQGSVTVNMTMTSYDLTKATPVGCDAGCNLPIGQNVVVTSYAADVFVDVDHVANYAISVPLLVVAPCVIILVVALIIGRCCCGWCKKSDEATTPLV